jgi:hypothetical protein
MPDLPDLLQSEKTRIPLSRPEPPVFPENFVECSDPARLLPSDNPVTAIPAPRCDKDGLDKWKGAIHAVAQFISSYRREVQLIAGIPLPESSITGQNNMLRFMNEQKWLSNDLDNSSVASSFVQLCYPWLRTAGSENLPEQLEPPEGALAGILARNAMTRGSFRSATNLKQQNIIGLSPKLRQDQMYAADPKAPDNASAKTGLIDRVSLFALTPDGIQLVSDVTTSNSVVYRQAAINRIISMVVRAARRAGEDVVFDSSGEQLWADLRDRMRQHLTRPSRCAVIVVP